MITFATSRLLDSSLSGTGASEESSLGKADDGASVTKTRPIERLQVLLLTLSGENSSPLSLNMCWCLRSLHQPI